MSEKTMNSREIMRLYGFLRNKTSVHELCIIREDGQIVGSVQIDNEDLWGRCLSMEVSHKPVISDSWDTF